MVCRWVRSKIDETTRIRTLSLTTWFQYLWHVRLHVSRLSNHHQLRKVIWKQIINATKAFAWYKVLILPCGFRRGYAHDKENKILFLRVMPWYTITVMGYLPFVMICVFIAWYTATCSTMVFKTKRGYLTTFRWTTRFFSRFFFWPIRY